VMAWPVSGNRVSVTHVMKSAIRTGAPCSGSRGGPGCGL
jgi:hypothetical protein